MYSLIKRTAYISMTEVSLVVVAFARNKYLAVKIGPEGFGIYGLLQSFFSVVSIFSGVFLSQAVTKYISEYNQKNDIQSVKNIAMFATFLTTIISVIITIIFLVNRNTITNLFLSEEVLSGYFFFFTISFLGNSLRPIFEAVFQGLKKIKTVIIFRFVLSIADLFFVILLVSFFNLIGFFSSIFISSILIIFLTIKFFKHEFKNFSFPLINERSIKKLLLFGLSGFFLGAFYLGGQYFLRLIILRNINIEAVGLFTAAMAIVGNMGIINRGIMFNFFPEISETLTEENRNNKINSYLRFILLINIPLTTIVILFGKQILLLLFSSEFLPLTDIFFWFALVYFFGSIATLFYFNLMGMGLVKDFALFGILGIFLFLAVPILLIKEYGLVSIAFGYLLSYLVTILCYYWFLHIKTNFRFLRNIFSLFLLAILTLSISIIYKDSNLYVRIFIGIISVLLTGVLIKKEEYNNLFVVIKSKVRK